MICGCCWRRADGGVRIDAQKHLEIDLTRRGGAARIAGIGATAQTGELTMPTLDFKGKQHIYAHHLTVPYRPLVPDTERSLNSAGIADDNLIIHGDNLHALKALLPRYAGRVKCIYIDPPYNTGNEGWVYNDKVNSPPLKEWFKHQSPVDGEDLERHDKWLCMMWPRLHLLKDLLSDDGVIFVSIDDNEQHHLRMLMDEVFGEEGFIAHIVVKNNPGGRDYGGIAKTHDYVLAYGNEKSATLTMVNVDNNSLSMRDTFGGFELRELRNRNTRFNSDNRPNLYYPFYVDLNVEDENGLSPVQLEPREGLTEVFPAERRGVKTVWRWQPATVLANINDVAARPNRNGGILIMEKFRRKGKRERSILDATEYRNEQGTLMLKALLDTVAFDYPKSTDLIKRLLELGSGKNSIILDSFAGSGTTAHAVLALNKEDSGNRKFILVECEDYADTITAERVRRAGNGVSGARDKSLQEGLGGSFTYCTLGNPIDVETMLTGEELPEYATLAAYLLHTAIGLSAGPGELEPQNNDGLFYRDDRRDYYLLYQPGMDWLQVNDGMLDVERARRIAFAAREAGKKAVVFGPGKYIGQRELTAMGITFCQLPYEMHLAIQ